MTYSDDLLEPGEAAGTRVRLREDVQDVDRGKDRQVGGRVPHQHGDERHAATQERRRDEERDGQQGAGRDPELGGLVGIRRVEDAHAVEVEQMHEAQPADREQGAAEEEGEVVIEELAQRPRDDEDAHRDQEEEELRQDMEEEERPDCGEGEDGEHAGDERGARQRPDRGAGQKAPRERRDDVSRLWLPPVHGPYCTSIGERAASRTVPPFVAPHSGSIAWYGVSCASPPRADRRGLQRHDQTRYRHVPPPTRRRSFRRRDRERGRDRGRARDRRRLWNARR